MSVDRNRATARRFFEDGWNRRDFTVFDEVLAPNWVYHGYSAAPASSGGVREQLRPLFTAFPDYHVTIEDVIAEGDKVVVRLHGSWYPQRRIPWRGPLWKDHRLPRGRHSSIR